MHANLELLLESFANCLLLVHQSEVSERPDARKKKKIPNHDRLVLFNSSSFLCFLLRFYVYI